MVTALQQQDATTDKNKLIFFPIMLFLKIYEKELKYHCSVIVHSNSFNGENAVIIYAAMWSLDVLTIIDSNHNLDLG